LRNAGPFSRGRTRSPRVLHDDADAVDAVGLQPLHPACAEPDQAGALRLECVRPSLRRHASGGTEVEVHAVLRRLRLGHFLEEQPRPGAVGVDQRRVVIAVVDRDAPGVERGVPRVEAMRWWRLDVVHRLGPEGRVRTRVGTVERHLKLGRHVPNLGADHRRREKCRPPTTREMEPAAYARPVIGLRKLRCRVSGHQLEPFGPAPRYADYLPDVVRCARCRAYRFVSGEPVPRSLRSNIRPYSPPDPSGTPTGLVRWDQG
jgi:hypothetical protein